MKLLIVMITYNRLDYSKRTLDDLVTTLKVPHYLIVVDNASTDGTDAWLGQMKNEGKIDDFIINPENYYPGKACNIGWEEGLKAYPEATHLMRVDNDFVFTPGWDLKAVEYFDTIKKLGQLGLDYEAIDSEQAKAREQRHDGMRLNPFPGGVGGVNIIKREVWDNGIRYDEEKWTTVNKDLPHIQEDFKFSQKIINYGYLMGHMTDKLAWTFANETNWSEYPDYYIKTMEERGYTEYADKIRREREGSNDTRNQTRAYKTL